MCIRDRVTSGNMGIALATIAKDYGNPVIICMPQFMSQERKEILNRLGVKLILTNSFEEAFQIAEKLAVEQQVFLTKQFENPNNAKAYIAFCKELEKKTTESVSYTHLVNYGMKLSQKNIF